MISSFQELCQQKEMICPKCQLTMTFIESPDNSSIRSFYCWTHDNKCCGTLHIYLRQHCWDLYFIENKSHLILKGSDNQVSMQISFKNVQINDYRYDLIIISNEYLSPDQALIKWNTMKAFV